MKKIIKTIIQLVGGIMNRRVLIKLQSLSTKLDSINQSISRIEETLNLISRSKSSKKLPIKVVFLVHHAASWIATRPLAEKLTQDVRFEVITFSLPHYKLMVESRILIGEKSIHEMLVEQKINHIRIRESDIDYVLSILKIINPDFIFRQTPWEHDLPENLDVKALSFSKLCYIPYGYMTVAIEDKQFNQAFHHQCFRIYWPDEIHKALSEQFSTVKSTNCIVSGYPKFDYLTNVKEKTWPITETSAFKLIWAPHWSFQDSWLRFGSFLETGKVLLDIAKSIPNIQIALRPHPVLQEYIDGPEKSSEVKKFVDEWLLLENTAMSKESDYSTLFNASDALFTDSLSFLSEYQLFDKPLVFYERKDHIGFNAAGKQLLNGLYRISTPQDIEPLIKKIMNGEEEPQIVENRKQIAKLIQPFPQQATSRIADDLFAAWNNEHNKNNTIEGI